VRRGERAASAPAAAPADTVPTLVVTAAAAGSAAPQFVVDPICGMTVAALESTHSVEHNGETVYFCCERCRDTFASQHGHAVASG